MNIEKKVKLVELQKNLDEEWYKNSRKYKKFQTRIGKIDANESIFKWQMFWFS